MGDKGKRNLLIGGIAALVVIPIAAWLAFGYFGVQSLWTDDEVDEELTTFVGPDDSDTTDDTAEGPADDPATEPTAGATDQPVLVATGSFVGVEGHDVSGDVNVIENPDGSLVVQFPELDSENGPDLVVWLSKGGSTTDGEYLDLGALKGNQGNQEYEVEAGTDVSEYDTVLIWCRRFSVGFGEAELTQT